MTWFSEKRGFIIFGAIFAVVILGSLFAYAMTGPMGIEERFGYAVGIVSGEGEDGNGWFGFAIEGDQVLYAIVLIVLAGICYALYARTRF